MAKKKGKGDAQRRAIFAKMGISGKLWKKSKKNGLRNKRSGKLPASGTLRPVKKGKKKK